MEMKKEEQEKPKESEIEQSQLDITKKEDELKETEEDTKSTMDAETMEAKEKKDKVNYFTMSSLLNIIIFMHCLLSTFFFVIGGARRSTPVCSRSSVSGSCC